MAHPDFIDIADTDIAIDKGIKTGILLSRLRQNQRAARIALVGFYVPEVTFTSPTYVTLATQSFWLPNRADFSGIQRRLVMEFEGKVYGGSSPVATYQISAVSNSDEPTANGTSYASKLASLNLESALKGTKVTVTIKGKVTSGVGYFRIADAATSLVEF